MNPTESGNGIEDQKDANVPIQTRPLSLVVSELLEIVDRLIDERDVELGAKVMELLSSDRKGSGSAVHDFEQLRERAQENGRFSLWFKANKTTIKRELKAALLAKPAVCVEAN